MRCLGLVACGLFLVGSSLGGDVHPPKPSFVTGVVVGPDGKPLGEYTLEMRITRPDPSQPGGQRVRLERVTTDAEGRFTSALQHTNGPVRLTRIDTEITTLGCSRGGLAELEPLISERVLAHEGSPLRLDLPCGPTFRLGWKPREEEIGETTPPALGASLARLVTRTPGDVDEGREYTTRLRVLDELHGWVRFAGWPAPGLVAGERVFLEVVTVDGRWKAVVDVTEFAAQSASELELSWRPTCRWVGTIADRRAATNGILWMHAERLAESGAVVERRRARVEPDGRVLLRGLDPGTWRFTLKPLRYREWTSGAITLVPDEPAQASIALEPIALGVAAECLARGGPVVPDGTPPSAARAWLTRAGEILPQDESTLEWRPVDGAWRASIAFSDVPPGEYQMLVLPPDGPELGTRSATCRLVTGSSCSGVEWR